VPGALGMICAGKKELITKAQSHEENSRNFFVPLWLDLAVYLPDFT
jgi:hypothetical protein